MKEPETSFLTAIVPIYSPAGALVVTVTIRARINRANRAENNSLTPRVVVPRVMTTARKTGTKGDRTAVPGADGSHRLDPFANLARLPAQS